MKIYKLQVILMYCYLCLYLSAGDPVLYPPFEFRREPREMGANKLSFPNSNFPPRAYHVPQQQIIHTGAMQSQPVPNAEKVQTENTSFSYNRFLDAVNDISGKNGEEYQMRSANQVDDVSKYKIPPTDGYARPNFDSWVPTIHDTASIYTPIQHQSSKASPKFSLLEPVSKMSGKMSGLMELIFALLGSSSNNLLTKDFKDILIEGIIKPMFVVKGGIKVLISKLSIPLVALVLINVEVLVTVWWLWDDCQKQQPQPYQPYYPQPVTDNYSYNTTY
ncbi:uncharacterized protein LOC112049689 [Bicyclus anynana]|uniref:Uncharacterized protein LOC112049689 n=1 Tax=Bicyclus anynana TaxID=110368 RepID=A0A6J1N969_BICAN|nr:uncharacterized protein LOC112049689 [Bicyclus anynana]